MRTITDEALDLIAGGYRYEDREAISTVTVVGSVPYDYDGPGSIWWPGGFDRGPGSDSAPVSNPEPPQDCTPAHTSPVPANAPKDVDMNELRSTMIGVAAQIQAMDRQIEHGAFVVRSANGTLRVGELSHGDEYEINMSIDLKPGDVIVAYIHSHPDTDNIDQRFPSKDDFDSAAELRKSANADKGMMLYILDNKSGDVFEYYAGVPRNTTKPGANISDDMTRLCG